MYTAVAGVPGGLVGGPRAYQAILWVQVFPSAHARRNFFLHEEID